ncbi:AAA family ATPase [Plesiomonas shigelloides]|uniref:AAA family ATPase n=1 Tax=Plesiomonas shigelloides TaxID=703 RepID=UPI002E368E84|nr:AAA family ATPase [Plesiomonas shigelloides]
METDKKVNIIYGLNGTGKSTFSNFLYNLSNPLYKGCSLESGENEEILIYNQQFIRDNFVDSNNLKGIFSLSKENKEIEEKINASEKLLEEIEADIRKRKSEIEKTELELQAKKEEVYERVFEIKRLYTGGDRVLEYCLDNLKRKEPLFNHIVKIEKPHKKPGKTIENIKRDVENISGETARKHEILPTLNFNASEIENNNIFSEIIVGSSDSPVSSLITELKNSDWVKKGLDYLPENQSELPLQCPFCQVKTITKEVIEGIKCYFDKSYSNSLTLINDLANQYAEKVQNFLSIEYYKSNEFSKSHSEKLTEAHAELKSIIEGNIAAIQKKLASPSEKVNLTQTSDSLERFNSILTVINNDINSHNDKINNRDKELAKLKSAFWLLMRWDYDQTIAPFFSESKNAESKLKEMTASKVDAEKQASLKRDEIVELQKKTVNIDEAVSNINNGLIQLGITDFHIEKHIDSQYRVVRGTQSSSIFTSLSEGEKMIISFLYFCELCKGKKSATETNKKKIAVIDDPVSSLSHIYVYNVGQMLKTDFFNSDIFEQVFVLTHSLYFFYELADSNHNRRQQNQKLFRLSKNSTGSSIKKMKYEEIQNDYHSYWAVINDETQPPALIANCMRNVIEHFFNFVQKADLSNVVQKPELQDNRYQAFCRYINRESHSLGQNIFDFKEFNYNDFREGLKLVFEVTGYPEHYQKMVTSITA